jgi:hypothetical protein
MYGSKSCSKDEARVPTTRKASSNTVETFPTNEINCRTKVMILSALGLMSWPNLRIILCAELSVTANHRLVRRTHNEDTAEVALEVVPVVAIVHPKDLILF